MLFGLSTHSPDQAREAVRVGADSIGSDDIEEKIMEIQNIINNHPPGSR